MACTITMFTNNNELLGTVNSTCSEACSFISMLVMIDDKTHAASISHVYFFNPCKLGLLINHSCDILLHSYLILIYT